MIFKRNITKLICLVMLISVIGSGCSNSDGELKQNNQLTQVQDDYDESKDQNEDEVGSEEGDESVTNDTDGKASGNNENTGNDESSNNIGDNENKSDVNTKDDNSIWELISESSVETSVFYAGFLNESNGVTVGYEGATSYTDDGGRTWKKSDNVSACRYGLDIYDESFIVDSGNSGVNMLSRDNGKSWTQLGDFPLKDSAAYNKFLSVVDTNNIYIGSKISLGVSSDGGLTWKELTLPEGCSEISGMFFLTPETGYLLDPLGTLYKTNDSCKTWTTQKIDAINSDGVYSSQMPAVAINFQDENHGIIVYMKKAFRLGCVKTEDGGNTWEYSDIPKVIRCAPYISRDGQYLTLSSSLKNIQLYKIKE